MWNTNHYCVALRDKVSPYLNLSSFGGRVLPFLRKNYIIWKPPFCWLSSFCSPYTCIKLVNYIFQLYQTAMGTGNDIRQCHCKCCPALVLRRQKKCCHKGFHIWGLSKQKYMVLVGKRLIRMIDFLKEAITHLWIHQLSVF